MFFTVETVKKVTHIVYKYNVSASVSLCIFDSYPSRKAVALFSAILLHVCAAVWMFTVLKCVLK